MSEKTNRLLEQASELVSLDEFDEALNIYTKILKINPNKEMELNKLMEVDKDYAEKFYKKGIVKVVHLLRIGKNSQALKLFERALKIQPTNIDGLIGMGSVLHGQKKFSDATACYDAALKINPKYPVALAYKGLSLGEQGKIKDALNHFKMALAVDKDYELAQISKKKALELLKSKKY